MAELRIAVMISTALLAQAVAQAQPVLAYPGFGNNGLVVVQNYGSFMDLLISNFVEHDNGKLALFGNRTEPANGQLFAAQYNANGSVDATFGVGGRFLSDTILPNISARAAVALPGGKLLMIGVSSGGSSNGSNHLIHLIRLNTDGSIDTGYADSGYGQFQTSGDVLIFDALLAPDGSIYMCGRIGGHGAVLHVFENGDLDTTFGEAGVAVVQPPNMTVSSVGSLKMSPQGYLMCVGYRIEFIIGAWFLAAVDLTGAPVQWYGNGGYSVIDELPAPEFEYSKNFVVRPDGSAIVSGRRTHDGAIYTTYQAFDPDGAVDLGFGNSGITEIPWEAGITSRDNGVVSLLPDGDVLISGAQYGSSGLDSKTRFVRLNADGTLDADFGVDGIYLTHRVNAYFNVAELGGLLQSGKLSVVGPISTLDATKHAIMVFDLADITTSASEASGPAGTMGVHPNPTTGNFTLDASYTATTTMSLLDGQGRTVQAWKGAMMGTSNTFDLDPALANGRYTLMVYSDGEVAQAPLLLSR